MSVKLDFCGRNLRSLLDKADESRETEGVSIVETIKIFDKYLEDNKDQAQVIQDIQYQVFYCIPIHRNRKDGKKGEQYYSFDRDNPEEIEMRMIT